MGLEVKTVVEVEVKNCHMKNKQLCREGGINFHLLKEAPRRKWFMLTETASSVAVSCDCRLKVKGLGARPVGSARHDLRCICLT
jgi:hypothetical protein